MDETATVVEGRANFFKLLGNVAFMVLQEALE